MTGKGNELFTDKMRKTTRSVHAVSDALVNAKFILSLQDQTVWAESLLVFYEIFKYLEKAIKESKNENLKELFHDDLIRTPSFEADLLYYLGPNWRKKCYPRESVKKYVKHLEKLKKTNSDLLMAYVYHLYMGLLSGGQILNRKWELQRKLHLESHRKEAVTDFGEIKISDLKSHLKSRMNLIAEKLSEEKKELLIKEGIKVFNLNNTIVRSVKSSDEFLKDIKPLLIYLPFILLIAYFAVTFFLIDIYGFADKNLFRMK